MAIERYFIYVDPCVNHNKFYKARLNDDGTIVATYGRVGDAGSTVTYNTPGGTHKDFDALCDSKLRKGYEEKTDEHLSGDVRKTLMQNGKAVSVSYQPLPYADMDDLINRILQASRTFMKTNYTVELEDVTRAMLKSAAANLTTLQRLESRRKADPAAIAQDPYVEQYFNDTLLDLFKTIPRRMTKVSEHLAAGPNDWERLLKKEEDLLQTLAIQVDALEKAQVLAAQKTQTVSNQTAIAANGLVMDDVSFDEEDEILRKLAVKNRAGDSCDNTYLRAYRIGNEKTERAYQDYCKANGFSLGHGSRLCFHGTKVENLWSIFCSGLSTKPPAGVPITGKAYGYGIYFADCSSKSLGYTSIQNSYWAKGNMPSGYLLMYEVATGKEYNPHSTNSSLNAQSLAAKGCHSVFSDAYRNTERVVYRDEQCTLRYLVEISKDRQRQRLSTEEKVSLRFTDAVTFAKPFLSGDEYNGGYKAGIFLPKVSTESLKILQRLTDTSLYPTDAMLRFRSDETGMGLYYGDDNVLMSGLTPRDLECISRAVMREYAPTKRRFTEMMQELGKKMENERKADLGR